MSRVLVIGSSHVGALKRASDRFAQACPDLKVDFFGVRGPAFLTGKVDETGVFTPGYGRQRDRELAMKANGTETVSMAGYDHVLMIGHRFGFPTVASLLAEHDLLEGKRSGRPRLIGQALLSETIEAVSGAKIDAFAERIAPAGRPVTVCLAPYPAEPIAEQAEDGLDLGRICRDFWTHPEAERVFGDWLTWTEARLAGHGHRLLVQPSGTTGGPYMTRVEFARDATNHDSSALGRDDNRHMNADFGFAVLTAFAGQLITQGRTKTTAAPGARTA